jgi:hypothetical protein
MKASQDNYQCVGLSHSIDDKSLRFTGHPAEICKKYRRPRK